MARAELLIVNGLVVTMDATRRIIADGAVAVADGRILEVGKAEALRQRHQGARTVEADGMMVLPGFIDGHNHPAHFLTKGLLDDIGYARRWATRLYPFDVSVNDEQSYWGSLGTFAEMIQSGTTCVADPGSYQPEATLRAAARIGIRACVTRSTRDVSDPVRPTPDDLTPSAEAAVRLTDGLFKEWHGAENGRIRIWYGLRTALNVSDELCRLVKQRADREGVGIHMHLAITANENKEVVKRWGLRPIERLRRLGLLDRNLYAVHMGALDDEEVSLVAERGVKICHCASASMLGGFGCVAHGKFLELANAGCTLSMGTDAAAISRFLDMTREMYLVAAAHKDVAIDAEVIGAHRAMEMATIEGARALLWDDEIGSLEPGKRADIVLVRMDGLEWYPRPRLNPVANLVYSSSGQAVDTVLIDGRIVMAGRRLMTIDEDELKSESARMAAAAAIAAGIPEEPRWPVQ